MRKLDARPIDEAALQWPSDLNTRIKGKQDKLVRQMVLGKTGGDLHRLKPNPSQLPRKK